MKKIDELEGLGKTLNFAAIKKKFLGGLNSIKEKLKLRKITRKKIHEIGRLETEIKQMEGLGIETIEDKLLTDLNMEKGFEIDEIKKIEIKLEELKLPKKQLILLENQLFQRNICITF